MEKFETNIVDENVPEIQENEVDTIIENLQKKFSKYARFIGVAVSLYAASALAPKSTETQPVLENTKEEQTYVAPSKQNNSIDKTKHVVEKFGSIPKNALYHQTTTEENNNGAISGNIDAGVNKLPESATKVSIHSGIHISSTSNGNKDSESIKDYFYILSLGDGHFTEGETRMMTGIGNTKDMAVANALSQAAYDNVTEQSTTNLDLQNSNTAENDSFVNDQTSTGEVSVNYKVKESSIDQKGNYHVVVEIQNLTPAQEKI